MYPIYFLGALYHVMRIILDTNFMMLPAQFGVDIFEELKGNELATFSSCINELKIIASGRGRDAPSARVALELIKRQKIEILNAGKSADKAIIDYAVKNRCVVATNDKKLLKALKDKGIKILRLRQERVITEE